MLSLRSPGEPGPYLSLRSSSLTGASPGSLADTLCFGFVLVLVPVVLLLRQQPFWKTGRPSNRSNFIAPTENRKCEDERIMHFPLDRCTRADKAHRSAFMLAKKIIRKETRGRHSRSRSRSRLVRGSIVSDLYWGGRMPSL